MNLCSHPVELKHFHLFCGIGGAARGGRHLEISTTGAGRVLRGTFRCIGGIDVVPKVVQAFSRYAGAEGTAMDLFSREQFVAFHGEQPPPAWREATATDLQRAAGWESPDIVVSSPPCKGYSGLVSEARAGSGKYLALNALALRGIALALEAWAADPPAFWLLENVPRLVNRGAHLLEQIVAMLEAAGYSVSYTIPDLGEIGGLAQSRKRLHLVARHRERVPVHVFEPPRQRLRAVGEVLGLLPMPGDPVGGLLHRLPRLEWRTWVRLALIPAGGDWRNLKSLAVENGHLRDYALVGGPGWHHGILGVKPWEEPAGTITSRGGATNGAHAVADPRCPRSLYGGMLGVNSFDEPAGTITADGGVTGGRHAIADPRPPYTQEYQQLGVQDWDKPANTVTGQTSPGQGPISIADPRPGFGPHTHHHVHRVNDWEEPVGTVTSSRTPGSGALVIADPRLAWERGAGDPYAGGGHYGVQPWDRPASAVTGSARHDNGRWSIADPRSGGVRHNNVFRVVAWQDPSVAVTAGQTPSAGGIAIEDPRLAWHDGASTSKMRVAPWDEPGRTITGSDRPGSGAPAVADPRVKDPDGDLALPLPGDRGEWLIRSLDGTWHRPMTVLERAALQGMVDVASIPDLAAAVAGASVSEISEWVGNAIPPPAMAETLRAAGVAILLSRAGETWVMSAMPVWVAPLARGILSGAEPS